MARYLILFDPESKSQTYCIYDTKNYKVTNWFSDLITVINNPICIYNVDTYKNKYHHDTNWQVIFECNQLSELPTVETNPELFL